MTARSRYGSAVRVVRAVGMASAITDDRPWRHPKMPGHGMGHSGRRGPRAINQGCMQRNTLAALVLGALLGLGIAFAGFTLAGAVTRIRESQRSVTVKGLAEREVDADLAIWPVTFKDTGEDLADLQRRVDVKRDAVAEFLVEAGFPREEVSFAVPHIQDRQTENTGQAGRPSGPRLSGGGHRHRPVEERGGGEEGHGSLRPAGRAGCHAVAGLGEPPPVPLHRAERHQAGDDRAGDRERAGGRCQVRQGLGQPGGEDPERLSGALHRDRPRPPTRPSERWSGW